MMGELSMPAGTATGSFDKGDGTSVSFTLDNAAVMYLTLQLENAVTGTAAHIRCKIGQFIQAFTDGAGSADFCIPVHIVLP